MQAIGSGQNVLLRLSRGLRDEPYSLPEGKAARSDRENIRQIKLPGGEPGAGRRRYGATATGKGDIAMATRDDLGARNVPAIDWLELFIWTLLITLSAALALVVMH